MIFSIISLAGSNIMAQSQSHLDTGMRFIEENATKWGLVESDYADVMISDMYTNSKTRITYIYFNQAYKGIPIYNAITPVVVSKKGIARTVSHGFLQNMEEKVNGQTPSVNPEGAIKASVAHLGLTITGMPSLKRSNSDKNIYEFGKANFSENEISVKLMYIPVDGKINLAWSLAIDETEDADYYNLFVDAQSGEVIYKHNYNKSCNFSDGNHNHTTCSHNVTNNKADATFVEANTAIKAAVGSYNVFPLPAESPIHGSQATVADPSFTDSSPFGWHDIDGQDGAEFTITRGNNVHAFLDKDDGNNSDGDEPNGGAELNFDIAYGDQLQAPDNEDAATINLFYMNNMIHDITARLGFDEQAGNFQQSNYGTGGFGGDYVIAKASAAFDVGERNNADFATPPDGGNGQMRMFLWDNPSGNLEINEPEVLAGLISDVGTADFGPPVPTQTQEPITGKVAIALDFSAQNNTTICSEVANPDKIAGNIALIDRGLCDFTDKAFNAQEAGAIAVIICNIVGGGGSDGSQSMLMGSDPDNPNTAAVNITTVSLSKPQCDRIRASILSDIDVNITIQQTPPNGPDFLDGSFDNGIIAHEYGHGISNRLVGGPSLAGCMSSDEQAGEGISDYFSLILTVEEGDTGADSRGIGNFATAQGTEGPGIRRYPYSTDMNINPQTYDDIKTSTGVHALGEIWAVTLWEIHWAFIERYGLDMSWDDVESGNFQAAQLAIEGMKMSPCNPSFIEARDAILQADSLLNDAANSDILWTAFAKRGLGYLATDGAGADDRSDGTENFDPFPLAIQSLKIQEKIKETVIPGEEIEVLITAQNHITETQTGVVITSEVPDGLTYIDGSSSMDATFADGVLSFAVGDMAFEEEITITYKVLADNDVKSATLFLDDVDDAVLDVYDFGALEGLNLWQQSYDVANSGDISWYASQLTDTDELDFWMNSPTISVFGNQPVLRFFHRYNTEAGADAGFIQISLDDGITFLDVKDKWLRNGYPTDVLYTTFAIPLLEGFSGNTNDEFIASYLDLSEFKGNDIKVRFRYGTNNENIASGEFIGWFVDDIELIDLVYYEAGSCISSDNSTDIQCSNNVQIIVDPNGTTNTDDLELKGFNIAVSPNPASDYISINLASEKNTPVLLSLTGIDGRLIKSIPVLSKPDGIIRTFDVSNLTKGIYLVQVKTETGITTKKVVIQ